MTTCRLSYSQQQNIEDETFRFIDRAAVIYNVKLAYLPVLFDLKGGVAGMYRVKKGCCQIRYNPFIFNKYYHESMAQTVPHEVAHYVVDKLYGGRAVKPHGEEWRQVMRAFDAKPQTRADFDLSDIPVRRQQRFLYQCACQSHFLSATRHNRIQCHGQKYFCKRCGTQLKRLL